MKKSFKILSLIILVTIIWVLTDFCLFYIDNSSEPEDWRKRYMIHEKVVVDLDTIILSDLQGYFGGRNVFFKGNEIYAQIVTPAIGKKYRFNEKRIHIKLTEHEIKKVNDIFNDSDFLRVKIRQRNLVPDEASPILWVKTKGGRVASAVKPASDKNPQFDPIYQWLLETISDNKIPAIYTGEYDDSWWPKGFPDGYTVVKAAAESSHILGFEVPQNMKNK